MVCKHPSSLVRKKSVQQLYFKRLVLTLFWDEKEQILTAFQAYSKTRVLTQTRIAFQRGLLHDNVLSYEERATLEPCNSLDLNCFRTRLTAWI